MDTPNVVGRVSGGLAEGDAARVSPRAQRPMDRGERDLVPRNLVRGEQPNLQAFNARTERGRPYVAKPGAEDDLHLADPGDAEDAENALDRDDGLGFFQCLSRGALFQRLAEFHVTGRQSPKTLPRLNRSAAHQDSSVALHNRPDDDLRVLIGNMPAVGADHALAVVTFRNLPNEGRHGAKVTRTPAAIKPKPDGFLRRYTLRSSNEPRGRFRGGVAEGVGDVATGGFPAFGVIGMAPNGWTPNDWTAGTLAGWTEGAAGVVARAMPMNVAGDSMARTLAAND